MRPPAKTLKIFSTLSLMSISLCLQQFSLQKAAAQGSADKLPPSPSAVTAVKQKKPWKAPSKTAWKKEAAVPKSQLKAPAIGPVSANPVPASPVPANPVIAKPAIAKPVAANPVAAKPVAANPVIAKPVIAKPVVRKAATTKPVNGPKALSPASKAAREAEKKIQDHDLASAVNIWSTELEARPENSDSWTGRAAVKRMIGDYRGAQDDLDHALELNANSVPALISRAAVRRRLADLRGAAKDIDKAVELAPRSYQAYAERSSLRFALNDMQGAMADYNYAITINPELNKQVAKYSYSANSQPQITIRDARDVSKVESRPEGKVVSDNRAGENKALAATKSSDASELVHYTTAELAHLNNTAVHEINVKHFAGAIKTFEELLEISPNYAHAKDNLVIAHNNYGLELSMRQPKEAVKQFRAALYLDPCQTAIRKNLSAIMRENGQDPTSTEDRLNMADQCLAQGDPEGAFVELSEALRIKNTPQLREKLQIALAAINSNDSKKASQAVVAKESDMPPPTILGTILPAIPESKSTENNAIESKATEHISTENKSTENKSTENRSLEIRSPEIRSTMTTIADLPNATLRTREPVAMRPVRDSEDKPQVASIPLESPSASPGYDAAFVKSTLDNPPDTVLQVARQLASENRELDAEALLNRLCEILRKKSLRGDKAAEQMLENALETLSVLYFKTNRLQNAEPTLRELVAIREKTKSPDDHILGKSLAEYAMVLKSLGRTEEASKQEMKANFILNQLSAH